MRQLFVRAATCGSFVWLVGTCPGCASDSVGDDGEFESSANTDGGANGGGGPDAGIAERACDMTGVWIAEQHTIATALSSDQRTTNWFYYDITQEGDRFTIDDGLNCGFLVDGTTTVTLGDDTLAALAPQEAAGLGRQGTFSELGDDCRFELDRSYNIRGADKAQYLTDHWTLGDPAKPLTDFPPLPKTPPGMQDWDSDGKDGITLSSGLGDRYVAQRDWNEHSGTVPAFATGFGGDGVITVRWDTQEAVSDQTSAILRVTATPKGDGWARYARVDDQLTVVAGDPLTTCRNVQQLAQQIW